MLYCPTWRSCGWYRKPPPAAGDLSIKLQLEPLSDGCTAVKPVVRSALLRYVAGQKIELRLPGATPRVTLASCPCEGLNLELHLENDRDMTGACCTGCGVVTRLRYMGRLVGLHCHVVNGRRGLLVAVDAAFSINRSRCWRI